MSKVVAAGNCRLVALLCFKKIGLSWKVVFLAFNAEAIGRIQGFKGGDFSQAVLELIR